MTPLNLFAIFHLNLAYSSIEVEQHAEVVERCYWPLLHLAEETGLPFGIEASVSTLEAAAAADPAWLDALREAVTQGACEFVGAGYAQLIGPLVPASVNEANLRLGNEGYERLLGVKPRVVLVNEQAYSAGLLSGHLNAGYSALFMEWDNAARFHPDWDLSLRYLPQIACGQHGERMPVLWNKSAAFQKFQHYAHGEIELDEYVGYLTSHAADTPRALPLYGNDIEIFDFRPGRYEAEPRAGESEWTRIGHLFERIAGEPSLYFVAPSDVLSMLEEPGAGTRIHLETPELPVPVKKQGKYNLTRWAVTGRGDLQVNSRCARLAAHLEAMGSDATDEHWRELCALWSSDFRTHITQKRWAAYVERLAAFEQRMGIPDEPVPEPCDIKAKQVEVAESPRFIDVETETLAVRFNARRGLAIESLRLAGEDTPVIGTLQHGYFDDINMTADFYTGHVVLEPLGEHKVTDLDWVTPRVEQPPNHVCIEGEIATRLGPVRKRVRVCAHESRVKIEYEFDWEQVPAGSLRLGHITLVPEAFDRDTLYYATHNGGLDMERFELSGHAVDHGTPVSLLVTAATCVGMTESVFEFGDARRTVRVRVDRTTAAVVGMVTYREVGDSFFCRLALSLLENDETRKPAEGLALPPVGVYIEIE